MSTLSVRLPDDVANSLKDLASNRNVSLNKLMNELSTRALLEEEARQQFLAAQLRGNRKRGLKILDELDALD
jgi:predicted transcriptional regulator